MGVVWEHLEAPVTGPSTWVLCSPDRGTGKRLLQTAKVWGLRTLLFRALAPWPSAPAPSALPRARGGGGGGPSQGRRPAGRPGPPGSGRCSVAMAGPARPALSLRGPGAARARATDTHCVSSSRVPHGSGWRQVQGKIPEAGSVLGQEGARGIFVRQSPKWPRHHGSSRHSLPGKGGFRGLAPCVHDLLGRQTGLPGRPARHGSRLTELGRPGC